MGFSKQNGLLTGLSWRVLKSISPLFLYTALSLAFFGGTKDWTQWICRPGEDAFQFVWFLAWWPFAISHGLNPFISHYVWSPHGANLTWDTAVPAAAFFTWPLTLLGGPILSFNVLTLIAPALSAWTAFLLTRYLTRNWTAALFAGYLYGFSSYEFGQLLGHTNLYLTFLIPCAVLICMRRVRGEMGRAGFIAALVAICLTELGLSSEVLATSSVFGALSWVIFLILAPKADRAALWRLAFEIVLAGIATILLAAPFLYYLALGMADVPSTINPPEMYSADPLNYFIPTIVTQFGGRLFLSVTQQFTGNASEQGAYLGLPLILITLLYFRDQFARPYVKAHLAVVILLVLASLGPWLHLGPQQTKFHLPWAPFVHLPLLRAALPMRFTLYVSLATAIAAAFYMAAPGIGRGWRIGRFVLAGMAALFLLPNTAVSAWARWPQQPFFTPANVQKILGPHANVIILPFGPDGFATIWQFNAGMQFTLTGGYVGFIPVSEQMFPAVGSLTSGIVNADFANDLNAYCATHKVDYILMTYGTPMPLRAAIIAQNWPQQWDHDVLVVKVPPPETLQYHFVQGDHWPETGARNWMGRKIRVATGAQAMTLTLKGTGFLAKPVHITADWGNGKSSYAIGENTVQVIALPANAIVTLTADKTFKPNNILHNHDYRHLSVLFWLQ